MKAKLVLAPALWAGRIESIFMLRAIDELRFSQGCTPSLMETEVWLEKKFLHLPSGNSPFFCIVKYSLREESDILSKIFKIYP